jgi:hypothetical protein
MAVISDFSFGLRNTIIIGKTALFWAIAIRGFSQITSGFPTEQGWQPYIQPGPSICVPK